MKNKKETCQERVSRKAGNAWIQVNGFAQKSRHIAQAKLKHIELQQHKKQFGIQYMTLLEKGASEEELTSCIEASREKIQTVRDEIQMSKATAASIDESTKRRIFIRSLGVDEAGPVRLKRGSKRMPGHGNFVSTPSVTYSDVEGPTFVPQQPPTSTANGSDGGGSSNSSPAQVNAESDDDETDFVVVVEPSAPPEEFVDNANN